MAVEEFGATAVSVDEILYNQPIIDGIVKSAAIGREIAIDLPENV